MMFRQTSGAEQEKSTQMKVAEAVLRLDIVAHDAQEQQLLHGAGNDVNDRSKGII
jgi:hypothetical protein